MHRDHSQFSLQPTPKHGILPAHAHASVIPIVSPSPFLSPNHASSSCSSPSTTFSSSSPIDPTLHHPRLLCLHGGGTNARIFRAQCRALRARLEPSFRLVFADAPFPLRPSSSRDVNLESVYGDVCRWGPPRSWLRQPLQPPVAQAGGAGLGYNGKMNMADLDDADVDRIDACLAAALRADDEMGATGPCVGVLGFSQGAGVAAGLLLRRQRQKSTKQFGWVREDAGSDGGGGGDGGRRGPDYRFAVLMAGRALVSLEPGIRNSAVEDDSDDRSASLLQLPTIHVHGLRDSGLEMHRRMLRDWCETSSTRTVEWDGDHRVPITSYDVDAVVAETEDVAVECGILEKRRGYGRSLSRPDQHQSG